jgi:hypothetical protein
MTSTTAGGITLLWTGCEVGIRILQGFIVGMLKAFTRIVMCSIRNVNIGRLPMLEACEGGAGRLE